MVGSMFGEKHPSIIAMNSNLLSCYSIKKEKMTDKAESASMDNKMKLILEKNFEIAKETFGIESIHLLQHLSDNLISRIATGVVSIPSEVGETIRLLKAIIEKHHGSVKKKIQNQFIFQI